jgi:ribonuclease P protein subunit POP4
MPLPADLSEKERFKCMSEYNNRNIVLHELIGLNVEVVESSDLEQIGLKGKVIDETKNLLLIEAHGRMRRLVKKVSTFRFSVGRKRFVVKGVEINFRPSERTEKALKFYKRRASRSALD